MNEITEQIFLARLFYLGTLVVICAYIYWHGQRLAGHDHKAKEIDSRVRVIELWPSQKTVTDSHEDRITRLEEDMDALKSNPITAGTLRLVKHVKAK
jgi:hypothetical protein